MTKFRIVLTLAVLFVSSASNATLIELHMRGSHLAEGGRVESGFSGTIYFDLSEITFDGNEYSSGPVNDSGEIYPTRMFVNNFVTDYYFEQDGVELELGEVVGSQVHMEDCCDRSLRFWTSDDFTFILDYVGGWEYPHLPTNQWSESTFSDILLSSCCSHYEVSYNYSGVVHGYIYSGDMFAHSVPEPGTLALLSIGLVGMGLTRRRRKS